MIEIGAMSHQEHPLLWELCVCCLICLTLLLAVGFVMLWMTFKQPAKLKSWGDAFTRFLIAKKVLTASLARRLDGFDSPALNRVLAGIAIALSLGGLCYGIYRLYRLS
jgi:hypothetical protein